MKTYAIGDRVRVRKDLVADRCYGDDVFVDTMEPYMGMEATIVQYINSPSGTMSYKIDVDAVGYYWDASMFE